MKKQVISILLTMTALLSMTSCSFSPELPELSSQETAAAVEKKDIRPQQDFYGYVNYDRISKGQIPAGRSSYSVLSGMGSDVDKKLDEILSDCIASDSKRGTPQQKVKDMYLLYKDTEARKQNGIKELKPGIEKIDAVNNVNELVDVMGELYSTYGTPTIFSFNAYPDGDDSSRYALYCGGLYFLSDGKEPFLERDTYIDQFAEQSKEILQALGADSDDAKKRAASLTKMIIGVAEQSISQDHRQNPDVLYNKYSCEEFDQIFSNLDSGRMLKAFGFDVDHVFIFDVGQMKKFNDYMTQDHLDVLKDMVKVLFIDRYSSVIPESFFENAKKASRQKHEDDKSIRKDVIDEMQDDMGYLYAEEICTKEKMEAVLSMTEDIRAAYRKLIEKSSRLSEETRRKYLKKLDNMVFIISNGEYDYGYDIVPAGEGGTLIGNSIRMKKYRIDQIKTKIGNIVDRYEKTMNPQEVNAAYHPQRNSVTIAAAMLNAPCFDLNADKYTNLGALGEIIAHEITHAFDSNSYKMDETGAYHPNWISDEDKASYNELIEKTANYYSNYRLLDVYSVNGEKSVPENIADLGACQCVLSMTHNEKEVKAALEGLAMIWADLSDVEGTISAMYMDEHSPSEVRVNAVVSSMDCFYDAYDVKEGNKMYVAPNDRIRIW